MSYHRARISAKKYNKKKFKWVNAYTISEGDESSVFFTDLDNIQTDIAMLQAL